MSGWYGAGSSALASRLACELTPQTVAVVRSDEEEVVEHAAGCAACAMRHDLVRVLSNLAGRRARPDRVIVLVDGWSDVVVAAQTLQKDPDLRRHTALDGIVTAVDAPSAAVRALAATPAWPSDTSAEQVAVADHLVLTSTDAATADGIAAARRLLLETNLQARVWDERSLRPTGVLAGGSFGWAAAAAMEDARPVTPSPAPLMASAVLMEAPGDLDAGLVHEWITSLHHLADGRLLRITGTIGLAGADRRLLCQGVGTFVDFEHGAPWGDAVRATRLLVAGRAIDADAARSTLRQCRVG